MTTSSIAYDNTSFQKFLNWTNQTEILGKEILALKKPSYKILLDVGAGNGDLTETYFSLFDKAVLLEPTQTFYERLLERFPSATIMQIKAEDFKTDESYFDLIVASHVLYYVAKPYEVIDHLLSALSEGGRLVIVLVDKDCGHLKFIDAFYYKITGTKHHFTDILWSDIIAFYLRTDGLLIDAGNKVIVVEK